MKRVEGQALSALAKKNASKKKYHHRLGTGGYTKKVPQWEKQEEELMSQGITPQTHGWPRRLRNWLMGHGAALKEDGSLVHQGAVAEVAPRLIQAISKSSQGSFHPGREKDELTKALQNPEHPG